MMAKVKVMCQLWNFKKWCVFDHQRRSEMGSNFNYVHTEIAENFIDNWDSSNVFPILMFYFSILPQRILFDFCLIFGTKKLNMLKNIFC